MFVAPFLYFMAAFILFYYLCRPRSPSSVNWYDIVRSIIRASTASEAFTEQLSTVAPSRRSSSTSTVRGWSRMELIPSATACVSSSLRTPLSRNHLGNESPTAVTLGNHAGRRNPPVSFTFQQLSEEFFSLKKCQQCIIYKLGLMKDQCLHISVNWSVVVDFFC